jgi:hypothetical protein
VLLPLQIIGVAGVIVIGGVGFTVMITCEVAATQGPASSGSFVVNVRVTLPLAILGVYVEVSEPAFEKVPLGAVHVEVVAPPPIVPFKFMLPPAQTVCALPASAVAAGLTVSVLEQLLWHPAAFVIVTV